MMSIFLQYYHIQRTSFGKEILSNSHVVHIFLYFIPLSATLCERNFCLSNYDQDTNLFQKIPIVSQGETEWFGFAFDEK